MDIFENMSPPNGEDKRDNDGEGTTESTVKGVNRVVGGQGNPAPFITPRPVLHSETRSLSHNQTDPSLSNSAITYLLLLPCTYIA